MQPKMLKGNKNMKIGMMGFAAVLGVLISIQALSQTSADSAKSKARNSARSQCLTENNIKVDFKAGGKLNEEQLSAMDKCMAGKGFKAPARTGKSK